MPQNNKSLQNVRINFTITKEVSVSIPELVKEASYCSNPLEKYNLIAALMGNWQPDDVQALTNGHRTVIANYFRDIANLFDPEVESTEEDWELVNQ